MPCWTRTNDDLEKDVAGQFPSTRTTSKTPEQTTFECILGLFGIPFVMGAILDECLGSCWLERERSAATAEMRGSDLDAVLAKEK
jgi:hypothetical protein